MCILIYNDFDWNTLNIMKKQASFILEDIADFFIKLDKKLIFATLLLSSFGVVAISSATSGERYVPLQIFGIAVGFVLMLIIARIDYEVMCDLYIPLILVCSALLLFTAFVADNIGGNRNWLNLGFINIQTSEFTKMAFIITIAAHINKLGDKLNRPTSLLLLGAHFLMYFIPIVLQGDIGSSLIYIFTFIVMVYIAGLKYRYFIFGIAAVFAAAPIIWSVLRTDQKKRLIYGFQPELDPLGYGYQPIISKIALGSGQMKGLGYLNGIQTQNELLPAMHTDFIYAVIGEEFGFIGCIITLALILLVVFLTLFNIRKVDTLHGRLICVGVACIIMFQTIINLGMVLGLSPVIGVTLPFVSYGGSSVMSLFMAIGLVLSVRYKSRQTRTLSFNRKTKHYR